jgi:hypothetical protein
MKPVLLLGLLGLAVLTLSGFESASVPFANANTPTDGGETVADAVVRINAEVKRDYGILSPTPITEAKLKTAIEFAAKELAASDLAGRDKFVNTLTQIASTGHIPDSVHFHFTPITGSYSNEQKKECRDGRHVAISLNYVMNMPFEDVRQRRAIGLSQIVEVFQIIKPQEQAVPFQPPKEKAQQDKPAG